MNKQNFWLGVLIVLLIVLIANSDTCKQWRNASPSGCGMASAPNSSESALARPKAENVTAKVSKGVSEAFSTRPYGYNKDTVGAGVTWQADALNPDVALSHDDYIRSIGIDKSTVQNHQEWYEDPNIKPYYGANFNLRSENEVTQLVPTVGLRMRPTAVPIGVSARQVPDLDERDYATGNTLMVGNFVGSTD